MCVLEKLRTLTDFTSFVSLQPPPPVAWLHPGAAALPAARRLLGPGPSLHHTQQPADHRRRGSPTATQIAKRPDACVICDGKKRLVGAPAACDSSGRTDRPAGWRSRGGAEVGPSLWLETMTKSRAVPRPQASRGCLADVRSSPAAPAPIRCRRPRGS